MLNLRIFKLYIVLILISSAGGILRAQQLPLYTQYLNNGFLINPAMAGNDGYTSFNTTYRKQWIGIENSPTNYSISAQTRLLKQSYKIVNRNVRQNSVKPSTKGRVGLGGYAFNDVNGLVNRTGISLAYAYHIFLYRSQISFGLSAQAFQFKIDASKLEFGNENSDPVKDRGLDLVTFVPDANVGFYWTSEKHFLGVSANQLFQSVLQIGSSDYGQLKLYRHYFFMGGYRFVINREFDLEPSFLLKTTEQLLPQMDLSARVFYQNDYWAGLSYRTSGSVSALAGLRVDKIFLGCAYDFALNSIRTHSFGSAEIVMSLKFGSNARRYRWINRY
ncbi:MAG: type IX secretion system membrane protein PorP/SprF [Bacteroidales bacterium]|nr:type IX secretion system membrane protein PorP/SprF [Bacteroidales bacterium]